ncbi:hypothetical protein JCM11491_001364 [Sporobolomyces phaffii]
MEPPPAVPPPAPRLVTPPWAGPESKPPSHASHDTLREYCTALGLQFELEDTKAVLRNKLDEWKAQQKALKKQIADATKPPPRPKKRPAPVSAPATKLPKTPLRTSTNRDLCSPSTTSPNVLRHSDELASQVDQILGDSLEESLSQIARETSYTPGEIEGLEGLAEFDDEEDVATSSKEMPSFEFDAGVARLLRLGSTASSDGEERDPREAMIMAIQREIQNGRRLGAIRTEHAVLKPFAKWIDERIMNGDLRDDVIDEATAIMYLKYSATRPLLDSHRRSSIKKIGTMLNRVRKAQVAFGLRRGIDYEKTRPLAGITLLKFINHLKIEAARHARLIAAKDVTEGTILEYGSWGTSDMVKLIRSVTDGKCSPTVIKTSFFLAWTLQSLFRLDDLQSLHFAYLQPWIFRQGRNVDRDHFCLVAISHEGKNLSHKANDEPAHTFLIPHRVPELCAIGHLAAHLQFLFDQTGWHEKGHPGASTEGWDWFDDASFRKVRLLPGHKSTDKPAAGSAISKQIALNLDACDMVSKNKAHLGRKIGCTLMENNGHDIERHGKWAGNTYSASYECKMSRDAVISSSGFEVGQPMYNPRTQIATPPELEAQIFPFVEAVFGAERAEKPLSPGTRNTLGLLLSLRKFFILHYAALYQHTPSSVVFRTLSIFKGKDNPFISWFKRDYPGLLAEERRKSGEVERHLAQLSDQGMRDTLAIIKHTVSGLAGAQDEMRSGMSNLQHMVDRRTAQFSPSKRQRTDHYSVSPSPSPSASPFASRPFDPRLPAPLPQPPAHYYSIPTPPPVLSHDRPHILPRNQPAPTFTASSSAPSVLLPSPHIGAPSSGGNGSNGSVFVLPRPSQPAPTHPTVRPREPPTTPPRPTPTTARQATPDPPSPNRLSILSAPTAYDFILPHDLAAFSTSLVETPALPSFPSPASFPIILDKVKQPQLLWRTYGPKNASEYKDVFEMFKHWEEGVVGQGKQGAGMLPAIKLLEGRFAHTVKGTGMRAWTAGLAEKDRTRLSTYRTFVRAVESHASRNSTTTHLALESLLLSSGIPSSLPAKFITYLKQQKKAPVVSTA